MTIKLKLQIVREGTKYESYRLTIPKAVIDVHNLRDKDFELRLKGKDIVLTPVKIKK